MVTFIFRFLLCNLFISMMILIFMAVKHLFRNILTGRMQYNLWFPFLCLLLLPFIPAKPIGFLSLITWLENWGNKYIHSTESAIENAAIHTSFDTLSTIHDFTLSVSRQSPSIVSLILFVVWITGIFVMLVFLSKSWLHFHAIQKSALPLQNEEVRRLYNRCMKELKIKEAIPIYSTAFLKSPVMTGLFKPRIYLPIHLVSNYNATAIRYMLLHELQHYKHKDAIANHLMNLACILYWFNPFVWYALKEMRNDREIACDASVLALLEEGSYAAYGNTLLNFAEKISLFPFASGISGDMKQLKKRIINIASYQNPTLRKRLKSTSAYMLIVVILLSLAPTLSTYAESSSHYQWDASSKKILYSDFSSYFGDFEGSFVLYDQENDSWNIYHMEQAATRVSPDSTYKIYAALFGLEENMITPRNSFIAWDNKIYPFEAWNTDQNLQSAMKASVNWYFEKINSQLGKACVYDYIRKIGYGNKDLSSDFSSCWLESSLKISPIEQVELLTKLYNNDWGLSTENINAIKDSICLSSSDTCIFYGKTGTGRVDGQDVNGWFVGFVETADNTYFFATNIGADSNATGGNAAEITMSILSDMNICK